MHERFLRFLVLFLVLFLLPVGCNFLFLQRSGELLTLEETVAIQRGSESPCLYGTAIHADNYFYKLKGYGAVKPDIAVIGSSTTMLLAESFFQGKAYNLGGAMTSIVQGEHLVNAMLAIHSPKHIILGVDFWWFNTAYVKSDYQKKPPQEQARITSLRPLFLPFVWMYEGKLSIRDYVQTLLYGYDRKEGCFLGVRALQYGSGFHADGSYDYTGTITGNVPSDSEKFDSTLMQIEEGSGRFVHDGEIGMDHLTHFITMIRRLEGEGVDVTVYIPPLAPTVYKELLSSRDALTFIESLKRQLRESGIELVDFMDARTISSNDCEFIDGIHGGDITNARVLLGIDEWRRERGLQPLAHTDELGKLIEDDTGLAMARVRKTVPEPEVDFLNIGCQKRQ